MNPARPLMRVADKFQQRRPVFAFPIGVWKKFGDDSAGSLAALIAYYAFASIFPLLLVLVTVTGIVLRSHPALKQTVYSKAAADFPGYGSTLIRSVGSMHEAGFALAVGIILTLLAARGVASAAQNAFNEVWEVPIVRRPGFAPANLRSLGLLLVVGIGEIVTLAISGLAGGAGHAFSGAGAYVAATVVALILNIGLFWVAFRLATASEVAGRDLWLGAIISAVAWQILQSLGTYLLRHFVAHASAAPGTFSLVLGLLAWFYLQAQITLYAVEVSVVHARRLWPRSMFPPPLTESDLRAFGMYAKVQQRRPEQEIESRFPAAEPSGRPGSGRRAKS
ncbi:MAG TPA: YihY/virulence factor BrkB family protein [Streptosporangiaceae bacterium]